MESWMVSLAIAVISAAVTYGALQSRVGRTETDLKAHLEDSKATVKDINNRIDAGFTKQDSVIDRVIVLEQNTKEHLGLREAEEKFVSHRELQLHLTNIENTMKHIEKNSDVMTKKLEELTSILSTNIVKTLSANGSK